MIRHKTNEFYKPYLYHINLITTALIILFMVIPTNIIWAQKETEVPKKNPYHAALWSILPGGGQFYNGRILKGIIIGGLEISLIGYYLYYHDKEGGWLPDGPWLIFTWAFSMTDAYTEAHFRNYEK